MVANPSVVPIAAVDSFFAAREQRFHRQFAVGTALSVRREAADGETENGRIYS
jgi:hypothetical protein